MQQLEGGEEEDFPDQNITTRMPDTHDVGTPSGSSKCIPKWTFIKE